MASFGLITKPQYGLHNWTIVLAGWYNGELKPAQFSNKYSTKYSISRFQTSLATICKWLTPVILFAVYFTTLKISNSNDSLTKNLFLLYTTWTGLAILLNIYIVIGHTYGWGNEPVYNILTFIIFCIGAAFQNSLIGGTRQRLFHGIFCASVLMIIAFKRSNKR